MNTPTHVTVAVSLLARHDRPDLLKWIIAGALAPDFVMFVLVGISLALGYSFEIIFGTLYFTPLWQNLIDPLNSIPLMGVLAGLAFWRSWDALRVFSLASLVHIALDYPLHREDAHHHLWPLSDHQFISPISYWDSNYFGNVVAPIEFVLFAVTFWYSMRFFKTGWPRSLYFGINFAFGVIFLAGLSYGFLKG